MHVVVIGAGVVGTSVAAELAERGTRVTVLERDLPGGGTSATSYAWVNANGKEPEPYFRLNHAGVRAHHELGGSGTEWFAPRGHLEVAADEAHEHHLARRVASLRERGYPTEEVPLRRVQELVPDLVLPDDARLAVLFPEEAHVFPLPYLGMMLGRARRAGAEIRTGAEVTALEPAGTGGRVRTADGSTIAADAVVLATGRWTGEVAQSAGTTVPLIDYGAPGDITVGFLAVTNPLPTSVDRLLTTPWLNVRPAGGGRLLLQALDLDKEAAPDSVPAPTSPLAQEFLRRLRTALLGTEGARIEQLVVGRRVMPADGLTIAGTTPEQPWLYAVATHSGVTLAPFLGKAVAGEVLGEEEPRLAPFRPGRFAAGMTGPGPRSPRRPGEQ
ncbi:NAD(P)/FAD-dependent oxidoreductase [Georgenia alba]|uniref:NAD(P)/FAD-dependent oxidoreductase n=1 Tax=Georgenia alba TaxID=2233858 RepID=A0ABW2Q522_9MICO